MDKEIEAYIRKNRPIWERTAKIRFWKNVGFALLVLFAAFLSLRIEHGIYMSCALVLALFVMFVLTPISIKHIRKNKNYCDEFD